MNYQELHANKLNELAKQIGISPTRTDQLTGRAQGLSAKQTPEQQLEAFASGLAAKLPEMILNDKMSAERAEHAAKLSELENKRQEQEAQHELDMQEILERVEAVK